ncbi:unnamed protein product [Arctia plantaginis]|uniref:Uncharacterized protein n=1 Tax=Arctia plantaginis TaxID=874455 RepID=A0A8S0YMY6_ARCPL|nr:unnamed protein product [Arctia plantaginis]CAB3246296.1 unnamed protein product [Arctia plantaginis]
MVLLDFIRVTLLTSIVVDGAIQSIRPEDLKGYNKICHSLTSEPYFEKSLAVESTWTVYYSWNLDLSNTCPELSFHYPDDTAINRIYSQMHRYMQTEPPWSEAVFEITMEGRRMLLFNDPSGIQGRFQGVPLIEDNEFDFAFKSTKIPLLEMSIKFLEGGKYLISSSCHVGGGSALAVRRKGRPKKAEIDAVAAAYDFGKRFPTCIKEW